VKRLVLFLLFSITLLHGIVVRGIVTDANNKAVAMVSVHSSRQVVLTRYDGHFSLNAAINDTLRFHKYGYKDQHSVVTGKANSISIVLTKSPIQLKGYKVNAEEYSAVSAPMLNSHQIKEDTAGIGARTATDWVSSDSELQVRGNTLSGEQQYISFIGSLARHTLVVLDGVPLNSSGEAVDMATIPVNWIESIEIVPNNAGAKGGSGSIGGMLLLHSKRNRKSYLESNMTVGSFGYWNRGWEYSLNSDPLQVVARWQKNTADNEFRFPNKLSSGPTNLTRKYNHKAQTDMAIQAQWLQDWGTILARFEQQDFRKELPGTYNYAEMFERTFTSGSDQNYLLQYEATRREWHWQWKLYGKSQSQHYQNNRPDPSIPFNPYLADVTTQLDKTGGQTQWQWKHSIWNQFITAEYWSERFSSTDKLYPHLTIEPKDQYNAALSWQGNANLNLFPFSNQSELTLRYDEHNRFGDFYTWRVAHNWKWSTSIDLSAGGNYGTSFTVPSFYNLYWKGDSYTSGNPDLKAERSAGYEVFAKLDAIYVQLRCNYSQNDIKDLIVWVPTFSNVWRPKNVNEANITNISANMTATPLSWMTIDISATQSKAINTSHKQDGSLDALYHKRILYTPEQQISSTLEIRHLYGRQRIIYQYVGKQETTLDNLAHALPAYDLFNYEGELSWRRERWHLTLQGKLLNVFDKHYEVYAYVPLPGFHWESGIKIQYNL